MSVFARSESGSILPITGLIMLLLVGSFWGLALLTNDLSGRARAQIAADAAALAGVSGGEAAARQAAAANGANLVEIRSDGSFDVTVQASIGRHVVSARAARNRLEHLEVPQS